MMIDANLESWLVQRLSQALDLPPHEIDPTATFARLGLDSLVLMGFVPELERYLGHEIDPQLFYDFPSPRALALSLITPASLAERDVITDIKG